MRVKSPKLRYNLFEEMNRQWDCVVSKKKRTFNEFLWEQKRRVKKLFDGKRIWKTRVQQYSSSYFCSCVSCCFSYQYFPYLEGFLLFHFFIEAYPFKNICQMETFVIVYLSKECLLKKQSLSFCKVSKTLWILKKPRLLN